MTFRLVGSFVSASGVPQFVGLSAIVDVATNDGTLACEGCCTPMCLALSTVSLYAENFGEYEVISIGDEHTVAGWNGQANIGTPGGCFVVGGCPTASGNRTWGAIKSLYR